MQRARQLVTAVEATGAGAFVADTAPIISRIERSANERLVAACDPLFDAVEAEELGSLVSTASVAELLIEPFSGGSGRRLGCRCVSASTVAGPRRGR